MAMAWIGRPVAGTRENLRHPQAVAMGLVLHVEVVDIVGVDALVPLPEADGVRADAACFLPAFAGCRIDCDHATGLHRRAPVRAVGKVETVSRQMIGFS